MSQTITLPASVTLADGPGGLPLLQIKNRAASAAITLQGAHIISYIPEGQQDLIWMSEEATFAKGKSLRGGVPLCWPWFGPHATNPKLPGHGHARTTDWKLVQVSDISEEQTHLVFEIVTSPQTLAIWDHPTQARYEVTVGRELGMTLETTNLGASEITIGAALHTYFRIGDIAKASVDGLDGCDYLDKVDGMARKQQQGLVKIESEVDRIYLNTPARYEIRDAELKRRIVITSQGSHSTVVWNPWEQQAAKMGDLGPNGYRQMLCVETANAAEDTVTLAPGAVHRLSATYRLAEY